MIREFSLQRVSDELVHQWILDTYARMLARYRDDRSRVPSGQLGEVRYETLRRDGMRVRGLSELSLPCEVVEDPSTLGPTDVVVLGVKTYQIDEALRGLGHVSAGSVFSVANGVMKNEELAAVFGPDHVMGCMADTSGELHADGTVEFTRNVCLKIGAYHQPTASRPSSAPYPTHC